MALPLYHSGQSAKAFKFLVILTSAGLCFCLKGLLYTIIPLFDDRRSRRFFLAIVGSAWIIKNDPDSMLLFDIAHFSLQITMIADVI